MDDRPCNVRGIPQWRNRKTRAVALYRLALGSFSGPVGRWMETS